MAKSEVKAEIGGRVVTLSNLDKPLYPNGFTKGEVIDYYLQIAPVLLPHLQGRVVTRIRFPDGVGSRFSFFEKNASAGLPDWVPRQDVETSDSVVSYPLVDEPAALVVLANLASLELHTPQWRVPAGTTGPLTLADPPLSDLLVIDLDPGDGVTMADLAAAALIIAARLAADDIIATPKTSGGKGLQLVAAIAPTAGTAVTAYVKTLAAELVAAHPDKFVMTTTIAAREGKILIDYNQNQPGRNTVSVYSLRAREQPTVSTPVTWDEIAAAQAGAPLQFTAADVLSRVERSGDLAGDLLTAGAVAPPFGK